MARIMAGETKVSTLEEKGYAVRYKPEGRGFDFRWGHWDFSFTYIIPAEMSTRVKGVVAQG